MAIDYIVAKEDYDEYMETIENLKLQLQQKENIIKEVREYIKDRYAVLLADDIFLDHDEEIDRNRLLHILEILDKENK